ncbi:thiamine phosphate synthase [Histophilus somni]|uniref:thiamine phosphate synthase n=1 Tax=Histophilus somni TaxID=731 RepID=UPI00201E95CB|nr:thiamine phosphate synthase [Histophilus somni]
MQHKYDIATAMRLYFIAGSQDVTHFASDPADNLLSVLEQALQAGITCYQFREKGKRALQNPIAYKALAIACRNLCRKYQVPFVVNDDVALAVEIGADGIHVGQTDMPPHQVKRLCTGKCFVGTSVNTIEQGLIAQNDPNVDYFGVGPIFPTQSKEDAEPVLSPAFITQIRANHIDKPMVAIGGIKVKDVAMLMAKGANGVAVISAITQSNHIEKTVKELLR